MYSKRAFNKNNNNHHHRKIKPLLHYRYYAERILIFLLGFGTCLLYVTNSNTYNVMNDFNVKINNNNHNTYIHDNDYSSSTISSSFGANRKSASGRIRTRISHDENNKNKNVKQVDLTSMSSKSSSKTHHSRSTTDEMSRNKADQILTKEIENEYDYYDGDPYEYKPAKIEQYFKNNMGKLGLNWTIAGYSAHTCHIWRSENITSPTIFNDLMEYANDLDNHTQAIKSFEPIPDLMKEIRTDENYKRNIDKICKKARVTDGGLKALFPSNQLSYGKSGYIDPLLVQMRHHKICEDVDQYFMNIDYLIHDFEAMCRKLKPTSRRILIDMGASLDFHGSDQPIVSLLNLYEKFGFHFDHIYGFEKSPIDASDVYLNLLPEKYIPSYHWINVGVSSQEGEKMNPLHSILKAYDEDDLIIVKLDIDMPPLESKLSQELLDDKDGIYEKLIDHFYFEDHVYQREMSPFWLGTMHGTIKDSFDLFYALREKGISAHYWV